MDIMRLVADDYPNRQDVRLYILRSVCIDIDDPSTIMPQKEYDATVKLMLAIREDFFKEFFADTK